MAHSQEFEGFAYESQALDFFEAADIDTEYVCLTGSVTLSLRGLRENGDVDLILINHPDVTEDDLPDFFDLTKGSFECVGYTDEDIVWSNRNYDRYRGLKLVRPELVFSYKCFHKRPKDIPDIDMLEEYALNNPNDWHWDLVTYRGDDRLEGGDGLAELGFLNDVYTSLREEGITTTTRKGLEKFLVRPMRDRVDFLRRIQLLQTVRTDIQEAMAVSDLLAVQYAKGYDMEPVLAVYVDLESSYQDASSGVSKPNFLAARQSTPYAGQNLVLPVSTTGEVLNDRLLAYTLFLDRDITCISPSLRDPGRESVPTLERDTNLEQVETTVLRDYGLLFQAILWPAVADYFDQIEYSLRDHKQVSVRNVHDVEFTSDDEFASFIADLYEESPNPEWSTRKKIDRLRNEEAHIRLVELHFSDPRLSGQTLSHARALKDDYRRQYKSKVNDYFADIVIHIGDNYTENRTVSRLLNEEYGNPYI